MNIIEQTRSFLGTVGTTVVESNAYDTAWLAALRTPGTGGPLFPQCLTWLTTHQHPDGSWGAPWPYYYDRLICTLRALLTLHSWGRRSTDRRQIELGLSYIWRNAGRQQSDPSDTIGFELIFPSLLQQAEQAGLALPYHAFADVQQVREQKLAMFPPQLIYDRTTPLVVSMEFMGDKADRSHIQDAQEDFGGVSISPSATAYLLQQRPDNKAAYEYLRRVVEDGPGDGGASAFFPIETFERGWVLHALHHALPPDDTRLDEAVAPIAAAVYAGCTATGWTASDWIPVKESDSTGVCYTGLSRFGYNLDPQLLYQYEEADHFRCYHFERNPSVSVNVHVLDALHFCDAKERAPRVEKIIRFLRTTRTLEGYWFDKWHVSPYYVTSHAILAAHDFAPDLVEPAIDWLIHTQWGDGSWGWFAPTLEETAYALLALLRWQRAGHELPEGVVQQGIDYLSRHFSPARTDYPPLWIAKALYTPVQAVQGTILAALLAAEEAGL